MEKEKLTSEQLNAIESTEKIKELLKQNNNNYIALGLLIHEANTYFRKIPDKQYKDLYAFCKEELGMCKTTVKYLVGINRRFANGDKLKPKFSAYVYSQLREMLPLSDSQLDLCNPSMTVADIKALKKVNNIDEDSVLNKHITNSDNISYVETYFKNDKERDDFLNGYASWELFKEIPELTLKFFRVKFTDDTYLIATVSEYNGEQFFGVNYGRKEVINKDVRFTIMNPKDVYSRYYIQGMSRTSIKAHISSNKLGYYRLVQND